MKTRKLRLVSALLAVAMLLALVPVGAFAEEDNSTSSKEIWLYDYDCRKSVQIRDAGGNWSSSFTCSNDMSGSYDSTTDTLTITAGYSSCQIYFLTSEQGSYRTDRATVECKNLVLTNNSCVGYAIIKCDTIELLNNATLYNGEYHVNKIKNGGTIANGTYQPLNSEDSTLKITNTKSISGGTFYLPVENSGNISGGTFLKKVTNIKSGRNSGIVSGGTFGDKDEPTNTTLFINNGTIRADSTSNQPTFYVGVENHGSNSDSKRGIQNGVFYCLVTNAQNSSIVAGTFNGAVSNNGELRGGRFYGEVTNSGSISDNSYYYAKVTNTGSIESNQAQFHEVVDNIGGTISAGTFAKNVTGGTVTGGVFAEKPDNENAIRITAQDCSLSDNNSGSSLKISNTAWTIPNHKFYLIAPSSNFAFIKNCTTPESSPINSTSSSQTVQASTEFQLWRYAQNLTFDNNGKPQQNANAAGWTYADGKLTIQDRWIADLSGKTISVPVENNGQATGGVYESQPENNSISTYKINAENCTINGFENAAYSAKDEAITVKAIVPDGYTFDGWDFPEGLTHSAVNGDETVQTFTMPEEPVTISVKTVRNKYNLNPGDFDFTPPSDLTYDGKAKEATVTTSKTGVGDITVKYYDETGNMATPIEPGDYTVKIDVADGTDYNAVTNMECDDWKFTVAKKVPTEDDFVFDKATNTITVKDGISGMGTITANAYYKKGADGSLTLVTDALDLVKPGTFVVKINVNEGKYYTEINGLTSDDWTFTVAKKTPTADDFVYDADNQKISTAAGVEGMGQPTGVTVKDADGTEHTLPDGSTRYLKPGEYTITTVTVAEGELYAEGVVDVSSKNWTLIIPDTTVPGGDDNDSTNPDDNKDDSTPSNPDDSKPTTPDDKDDTPNTPSNPDDNTPSKPDDGATTPDEKPDEPTPSNPDDGKSDDEKPSTPDDGKPSEPDSKPDDTTPEEPETEYPISGNDDAEVAVTDPDGNARADGKSQAGDTVTITLPEEKRSQGDMVFDGWVLNVQPSEVNTEDVLKELVANGYQPGEPETSFTMPELPEGTQLSFRPHYVTPDQAGQSDDSFLLTAAAVTGGAVLTGIVVWQGYNLFAQEYLKANLPAGTAIPQDRAQLALLLWDEAHDPAPVSSTLYTDVSADDANAQAAARWAVENELLAPADKNDASLFAPNKSVSVGQVYRAWKKVQALK